MTASGCGPPRPPSISTGWLPRKSTRAVTRWGPDGSSISTAFSGVELIVTTHCRRSGCGSSENPRSSKRRAWGRLTMRFCHDISLDGGQQIGHFPPGDRDRPVSAVGREAAERDGRLEQLAEQRDLAESLGRTEHGAEVVDGERRLDRNGGGAVRLGRRPRSRRRDRSGADAMGVIGVESGRYPAACSSSATGTGRPARSRPGACPPRST